MHERVVQHFGPEGAEEGSIGGDGNGMDVAHFFGVLDEGKVLNEQASWLPKTISAEQAGSETACLETPWLLAGNRSQEGRYLLTARDSPFPKSPPLV